MVSPKHRKRNDYIAMMIAFLDESGTHAHSEITAMAGFIGTEGQWAVFEDRWAGVVQAHPEIGSVHGKILIPRRGLYRSWEDEKYWKFVTAIGSIIRESEIVGVTCILHNSDYEEYRNKWKGTKVQPDSAYGMCFRACMNTLGGHVHLTDPNQRLSLILEDGHRNRGEALEIFNGAKHKKLGEVSHYLEAIAFASKESYGALQAADLFAYGTHKYIEEGVKNGGKMKMHKSYQALVGGIEGKAVVLNRDTLGPISTVIEKVYKIHQDGGRRREKDANDEDK